MYLCFALENAPSVIDFFTKILILKFSFHLKPSRGRAPSFIIRGVELVGQGTTFLVEAGAERVKELGPEDGSELIKVP